MDEEAKIVWVDEDTHKALKMGAAMKGKTMTGFLGDIASDIGKDERKKISVAQERVLAKALDDLAGAKFVRALRKAA